jgi:hypothetical protein
MRYELDANGYVLAVFWGCCSGECQEYTGTVPIGYNDLNEWSENALINAYYIDENGNLVLDASKLAELETKIEQDTIDNEPLLRKDLYGYTDAIKKQYIQKEAKGTVITIDNVEKINPIVKITDINCYEDNKIDIITQGRNMLKVNAVNDTIEGITFTKLMSGGIKISGTATANIEYNLAGSDTNLTSLFALKKNKDYYLNIGGLDCELKYYDGTTSQVYAGASGVINLSESKAVTQVLIKIPSGTTIDKNIYPMLEYGSTASPYEGYKHRILTIDYNELVSEGLFPSDVLFPSDELYPKGDVVNYIYIENSEVYISINGIQKYLVKGNVNLFDGYDTIYTMQDTNIEMTYFIDSFVVEERIAKIEVEQDYINLEVSKKVNGDEVVSTINQSAEEIKITGNRLVVDADNFDLDKKGNMTCNSANIKNATITDGNINMKAQEGFPIIKLSSITNNEGTHYEKTITSGNEWIYKKKSSTGEILNEYWYGNAVKISETNPSSPSAATYNDIHLGFNLETGSWDKNTYPVFNVYRQGTQLAQIGEKLSWFKNLRYDSIAAYSLEKIKKNFSKFDNGLKLIKESEIFSYNLKDENDSDRKHIGLVIGDNYKTPKEILTNDNQAVDIYSMISVTWKAIQEQQEIIEKLQNEIKNLKESDE